MKSIINRERSDRSAAKCVNQDLLYFVVVVFVVLLVFAGWIRMLERGKKTFFFCFQKNNQKNYFDYGNFKKKIYFLFL